MTKYAIIDEAAYNIRFGKMGADGSRVSAVVILLFFISGGRNSARHQFKTSTFNYKLGFGLPGGRNNYPPLRQAPLVSGYMIRPLVILTIFLSLFSCDRTSKNPQPKPVNIPKQIDMLEPDLDTLPNGKRLLDNMDSGMVHYYKEVVGSDTLKGGYISCYGIDDSTKYFYLRHGDTLHLLNQTPIYTSTWSLGTLEEDYNSFILTTVDNGNGVPFTYQIFDKQTGKNILGDKVYAWNYHKYNDSLFFLYDNHTVNYIGTHIDRKEADSIFLYNAASGRRQGFKLAKENPNDIIYYAIKNLAKHSLTISRREHYTDEETLVKYSR